MKKHVLAIIVLIIAVVLPNIILKNKLKLSETETMLVSLTFEPPLTVKKGEIIEIVISNTKPEATWTVVDDEFAGFEVWGCQ